MAPYQRTMGSPGAYDCVPWSKVGGRRALPRSPSIWRAPWHTVGAPPWITRVCASGGGAERSGASRPVRGWPLTR